MLLLLLNVIWNVGVKVGICAYMIKKTPPMTFFITLTKRCTYCTI